MKKIFNLKLIDKLLLIIIVIFFLANVIDLTIECINKISHKALPYTLKGSKIIKTHDPDDFIYLNWDIIAIDSVNVNLTFEELIDKENEDSFFNNILIDFSQVLINYLNPFFIKNKEYSMITIMNPETEERKDIRVQNVNRLNTLFFWFTIAVIGLNFFVFFNSIILLYYSDGWEGRLLIFILFTLFLPFADNFFPAVITHFWKGFISPFWGIVFYHFIALKTKSNKRILRLYIITILIFAVFYFLVGWEISKIIAICWTLIWFFKGYRMLRKNCKSNEANLSLKRLFASFKGLQFSGLSILSFFIVIFLIGIISRLLSSMGYNYLNDNGSFWIVTVLMLLLLSIIGFILGIIWFLGSFTWSLVTGTFMDIKIRSTIVYSMVGVLFVILFGMLDYSLGELLQGLFGNFIGSEFIAGIPATISLLVFFNPVRTKIEHLVDQKLNSTELQFLQNTETFTRNLSEEGVLEGFEEYICENLFEKLSVTKVALIAFDNDNLRYRFNEIRGDVIIENSFVEDSLSYLESNEFTKINNIEISDNSQDIGSFKLLIPIIIEVKAKWWLALGNRIDGIPYSKKDIEALLKLCEQIKLSLKFILVYEDIVKAKYNKKLIEKDKQLKAKEMEIKRLNEMKVFNMKLD